MIFSLFTSSKHDSEGVEVRGLATLGDEALLDQLVGDKVSSGAGTIAQQGSTGTTEDGGETTLLVEGADNVDGAVVELVSAGTLSLYSFRG